MARPKKTGLDYFPFDVDFFNNKKIKILRAKYGNNGIAVFIFLLCEIYKNGYYIIWDDDYRTVFADELRLTEEFVEKVILLLAEKNVITIINVGTNTYLTSKGVQKRFQLAVKQRATRRNNEITVDGRIWLLPPEETEIFICPATNGSLSYDKSLKESKVNKSKVK